MEDDRRQARVHMRLKKTGIRIAGVVLCVVCCAILLLVGLRSTIAAHQLFGRMTYVTNSPDIAEQVTLVNGEGVVWNGRLHVSLYYAGQYVYGDFNRDGRQDAAVVIGESQGGSDDEIELAFLIHDGTQFVHRQTVYLGDSAIINSVKERSGSVMVDMLIHQEGDCQAGPTKRVTRVHGYERLNNIPQEG